MNTSNLKLGIAQIAPVWLNIEATLAKITGSIKEAASLSCELLVFGESLLPGYPFWLDLTHASQFNSSMQKEIHAHYLRNAVQIERGDLTEICDLAKEYQMAIYLGIAERAENRGSHSIYCSLVYIDSSGVIKSVHRKLQPTYEERLCWAPGDGNGLQVHNLKDFKLGGLNCWENWMPLSRTALYGMGEDLHIAVWPGAKRHTQDITRFIAKESRSFVVSASGFMAKADIPLDFPHRDLLLENCPDVLADGGSCIAAPNGEWLLAPQKGEQLLVATIHHKEVLEERQNFDLAGHYSRPDVTRLVVNTERQALLELRNSANFKDSHL